MKIRRNEKILNLKLRKNNGGYGYVNYGFGYNGKYIKVYSYYLLIKNRDFIFYEDTYE